MDDITKLWEMLSLIGKEGTKCSLTGGVIDDSFTIVAKFLTKRKFNLEAVAQTVRSVWKANGDFKFHDLGNNKAHIVFIDEIDMNRILLQSPWCFVKYLMVLHWLGENECINAVCSDKAYIWVQILNLPNRHMTKENGALIGSTLGEVISVDALESGQAWGTCVRVQVKIDITKPLCRGRMVRLSGSD